MMKSLLQSQGKRGYLQVSFGWLFAIIVGVFILFLAIFFITKLINTEGTIQSAKTGKEIGILLNPLETGFETGKTTSFNIPVETRIYNKCNSGNGFGRQLIEVSQKSFGKWKKTDLDVGFSNKYIFSNVLEGKEFYIFSKPFNFPFKVSDLIFMSSSSDEYCFVNAPEDIRNEIEDLKQENFLLDSCSGRSIKICFGGGSCDINVNYNSGIIERDEGLAYFEGDALMYAGIFSDKDYECQLKRLMQRIKYLSQLYRDKAMFVSQKGCDSNLEGDLLQLINLINNFEDSSDLTPIKNIAEDIEEKNDFAVCKLW